MEARARLCLYMGGDLFNSQEGGFHTSKATSNNLRVSREKGDLLGNLSRGKHGKDFSVGF